MGIKHHGVCGSFETNPKLDNKPKTRGQNRGMGLCSKQCAWNVRNKPETRQQIRFPFAMKTIASSFFVVCCVWIWKRCVFSMVWCRWSRGVYIFHDFWNPKPSCRELKTPKSKTHELALRLELDVKTRQDSLHKKWTARILFTRYLLLKSQDSYPSVTILLSWKKWTTKKNPATKKH